MSVFLYQRDVRTAAGTVANDCAGSARSFAQVLHHVYGVMGGRVALGSDVNGVGQLPGPRFGPNGAAGIRGRDDQNVRRALGRPLRRDEVLRQAAGVRYATPPLDYRQPRFAPGDGAPMTPVEQQFWEALTMWRVGVAPESADHPAWWRRSPVTHNRFVNLCYGLRAESRDERLIRIPYRLPFQPWPLFRDLPAVQLAAFLARHSEPCRETDPEPARRLTSVLSRIWDHWAAMESGPGPPPWMLHRFGPTGSGLYTDSGALIRSTAGRRDFDVNVDGVAHYGLLPDFLQDLRNVGTPAAEVDALYRGAEHYIQVWERCLEQAP